MSEIVWSSFHFLRPELLWLLIPAGVLLYFWLNNVSRQDGWQQSCDPELLQAMQIQSAAKASRWIWLYWPITLLTILALAGPAVRQIPVPVVKNQSALIVALDVSKSMLSDDLKPSRLQRAKFKIQDLLDNRKDGQTALVVYAGDAFVVTPLTDDIETIVSLLDVIDPSIMPVTGTNTVAALDKATDLLTQAGVTQGQILLVTDSIDMYKTQDRLSEVKDNGTTVHVLAVGTAEGAPIPTQQGFLKDLRGQIVIPQVDYSNLQQAAQIGHGRFSVLSNNASEDQLYEVNPNTDVNDKYEDNNRGEQGGEKFIDDGPLLALLIIPLLALLYRRGILMVLCMGFMLNSETSYALSWDDLWLNKDQQAYRQLETAPSEAFNQANNEEIKAAAAYKKQDFKAAKNLYKEDGQTLEDFYNRGNALAQAGDFENALESYDKALSFDSEDEDTLYNKSIVEQALEQQKQQEQQQNQENQENQESQEDQENQESQDSEQSQQNQQDQQQESSEQEKQEQQQQAEQDKQSEADQENSEEQKTEEELAQQQAEEQEQAEQQQEIELTPEEKALDAEEKQAMEQWLRRIKDDPGGLMRRKFLYQYHKRNQDGESYDNQTTEDW